MSCEAVEESLVALLDDEIAGAERDAVEAHVAGCGTCAHELGLLRKTRALLSAGLTPAARPQTAGAFEELWRQVEADAQPALRVVRGGAARTGARRRRVAWATGLALAASLALVVLGLEQTSSLWDGAAPSGVTQEPSSAPALPAAADARVKTEARAPSRVAKAPAKAPTQLAKRASAPEQVAETANEIDPPRDLLERPDLFVNYPVMRKLDEMRHLDAVLADQGNSGGAG
jgi:anti-sigma factor RsiW